MQCALAHTHTHTNVPVCWKILSKNIEAGEICVSIGQRMCVTVDAVVAVVMVVVVVVVGMVMVVNGGGGLLMLLWRGVKRHGVHMSNVRAVHRRMRACGGLICLVCVCVCP